MKSLLAIFCTGFVSLSALASIDITTNAVNHEKIYYRYLDSIESTDQWLENFNREYSYLLMNEKSIGIDKRESISIDALWDRAYRADRDTLVISGVSKKREDVAKIIKKLNLSRVSTYNLLRIYILSFDLDIPNLLQQKDFKKIKAKISFENSARLAMTILSHQEELRRLGHSDWIKKSLSIKHPNIVTLKESQQNNSLTDNEVRSLVYKSPSLANFKNGKYKKGIRVFLFCRKNRKYPCRFVMKNKKNKIVRTSNGEVWTQPALAHSRRGLPYNIKNGETPAGVFTLDSVMPKANRKNVFGKYRRIIISFIKKSTGERRLKRALPRFARNQSWWKQSIIARDVGRSALRIHGTGRFNTDPDSSYYPHVPTSGCISTLEGQYEEKLIYKNQRLLLDIAMKSLNLAVLFKNETKIKGVLYVVNINDEESAVSNQEIQSILASK